MSLRRFERFSLLIVRPSVATSALEPLIQALLEGARSTPPGQIPYSVTILEMGELFQIFDEEWSYGKVISIGSLRDMRRVEDLLNRFEFRDIGQWIHIPEDGLNEFPHSRYSLGYGSLALSVAHRFISEDFHNYSFLSGVKILLLPGEDSGWLAGASYLAKILPQSQRGSGEHYPHVVVVPERTPPFELFLEFLRREFAWHNRVTVALSLPSLCRIMSDLVGKSSERLPLDSLLAMLGERVRGVFALAPGGDIPSVRTQNLTDIQRQFVRRVSSFDHALAFSLADFVLDLIRNGYSDLVPVCGDWQKGLSIGTLSMRDIVEGVNPLPVGFIQPEELVPSEMFIDYLRKVSISEISWHLCKDESLGRD